MWDHGACGVSRKLIRTPGPTAEIFLDVDHAALTPMTDEQVVHRTRQVWALEQLINTSGRRISGTAVWDFSGRRYWDVLEAHAARQILRAENGMGKECLRRYYP